MWQRDKGLALSPQLFIVKGGSHLQSYLEDQLRLLLRLYPSSAFLSDLSCSFPQVLVPRALPNNILFANLSLSVCFPKNTNVSSSQRRALRKQMLRCDFWSWVTHNGPEPGAYALGWILRLLIKGGGA